MIDQPFSHFARHVSFSALKFPVAYSLLTHLTPLNVLNHPLQHSAGEQNILGKVRTHRIGAATVAFFVVFCFSFPHLSFLYFRSLLRDFFSCSWALSTAQYSKEIFWRFRSFFSASLPHYWCLTREVPSKAEKKRLQDLYSPMRQLRMEALVASAFFGCSLIIYFSLSCSFSSYAVNTRLLTFCALTLARKKEWKDIFTTYLKRTFFFFVSLSGHSRKARHLLPTHSPDAFVGSLSWSPVNL